MPMYRQYSVNPFNHDAIFKFDRGIMHPNYDAHLPRSFSILVGVAIRDSERGTPRLCWIGASIAIQGITSLKIERPCVEAQG